MNYQFRKPIFFFSVEIKAWVQGDRNGGAGAVKTITLLTHGSMQRICCNGLIGIVFSKHKKLALDLCFIVIF